MHLVSFPYKHMGPKHESCSRSCSNNSCMKKQLKCTAACSIQYSSLSQERLTKPVSGPAMCNINKQHLKVLFTPPNSMTIPSSSALQGESYSTIKMYKQDNFEATKHTISRKKREREKRAATEKKNTTNFHENNIPPSASCAKQQLQKHSLHITWTLASLACQLLVFQ